MLAPPVSVVVGSGVPRWPHSSQSSGFLLSLACEDFWYHDGDRLDQASFFRAGIPGRAELYEVEGEVFRTCYRFRTSTRMLQSIDPSISL